MHVHSTAGVADAEEFQYLSIRYRLPSSSAPLHHSGRESRVAHFRPHGLNIGKAASAAEPVPGLGRDTNVPPLLIYVTGWPVMGNRDNHSPRTRCCSDGDSPIACETAQTSLASSRLYLPIGAISLSLLS